jgi:TM2 domain-containing membrane protein YozV
MSKYVEIDKAQPSKEKKLTLLLLCWLFGLLGVHRFYAGKYLAATLQLLLLTSVGVIVAFEVKSLWVLGIAAAGLLLLWWIIDALLIIMGKFTDKEGRRIIDWI